VTHQRRQAIIRLLETRDDHLPTPTRRDYSTAVGFVDHVPVRETCPDCLANDRRMYGCETCGGRGFLEFVRAIDPYKTQKVQPYGLDGSRLERARERDAQIARLESQTAPPRSEVDLLAEANEHPFGWELARERMYAQFDYAALDLALGALRDADGGACHALHALYVYRWAEPSAGYEAALLRGLAFLDARLPHPLRAPRQDEGPSPMFVGKLERGAGASARDLRNGQICQLAHDGLDPAEIAKQCHVSIRTVYNVVQEVA
jgi:hypothetical protein